MRISETQLRKAYDTGVRHIPRETRLRFPIALPTVSLRDLLAQPNAKAKIRAIPPQQLYFSLKEEGLADCLEVLPLISQTQFTRICDYDVWQDEKLSLRQLFYWLQHCEMAKHGDNFRRFRKLEEEYQLAALIPCIRIFDQDEYEKLSDSEQDQLHGLPGNAFYYAIECEDPDVYEGVQSLIASGMEQDMNYLISLLTHAAYMPPLESELLLSQFRRARLEEDGFVTEEESQTLFQPLSVATYAKKWQVVPDSETVHALALAEDTWFLEEVLRVGKETWTPEAYASIMQSFLYLSNATLVACQVPLEDRKALEQVFAHVQGWVNLGLEFLSQGQRERGAQILAEESPRTLFRLGFSILRTLQEPVVVHMKRNSSFELFCKYWRLQKYGLLLRELDLHQERLGFLPTEFLKGLFNRFPMVAQPATEEGRIFFEPVCSLKSWLQLHQLVQTFLPQPGAPL